MTQEEILELMDSKNKLKLVYCTRIKEEANHLPDEYSIFRLKNYINSLVVINEEIKLLTQILL